MSWPPVKAWTSKITIEGNMHFVAINYGGKLIDRWVILMSVLESNVVVKVYWSELNNPSNWKRGWDQNNHYNPSKLSNNKGEKKTTNSSYPSADSGLTIPITKNIIRPWFVSS